MNRPTSVAVIAVIHWCIGALYVIGAILFGVLGSVLGSFLNMEGWEKLLPVAGIVIAVILAVIGLVLIIVGYGVWTLQGWARIVVIIFAVISILNSLVQISAGGVWRVIHLAVAGWMIWYMFQPEAKQAFRA